jgi:hypothetical protein
VGEKVLGLIIFSLPAGGGVKEMKRGGAFLGGRVWKKDIGGRW